MKVGMTLSDDRGLDSEVSRHFGQCSHFLIAEIADGKMTDSQVVPNRLRHGGGGCLAVDGLLDLGVDQVISGGMGLGAQGRFEQAGVKVYGHTGTAKEALAGFLAGKLKNITACRHQHQHHGGCHQEE